MSGIRRRRRSMGGFSLKFWACQHQGGAHCRDVYFVPPISRLVRRGSALMVEFDERFVHSRIPMMMPLQLDEADEVSERQGGSVYV